MISGVWHPLIISFHPHPPEQMQAVTSFFREMAASLFCAELASTLPLTHLPRAMVDVGRVVRSGTRVRSRRYHPGVADGVHHLPNHAPHEYLPCPCRHHS